MKVFQCRLWVQIDSEDFATELRNLINSLSGIQEVFVDRGTGYVDATGSISADFITHSITTRYPGREVRFVSVSEMEDHHTERTPLLSGNNTIIDLNTSNTINSDASDAVPVKKPASTRLRSLDVFRGMTMVGMILVDNQGNFDHVYAPLNETDWNGLSSADFVFPFFLFIAGVSSALAFKNANPRDKKTWFRIVKRFILMLAIGLIFNVFGSDFKGFHHIRFPGVLQRIAVCYFIVVVMILTLHEMVQRVVIVGCIVLYLGLMLGLDVPGCGRGNLTPHCNAGAYIDFHVWGRNMIHPNDPEGLVSTLTAIVTTYLGLEFGRILAKYGRHPKSSTMITLFWMAMSTALLIISVFVQFGTPYNKKIWSVSFVAVTAGFGGYILLQTYWFVDLSPWKENRLFDKCISPFVWLGMNPIAIFIGMVSLELIWMDLVHIHYDGKKISLYSYIFWKAFAPWLPYKLGSLVMSLLSLALWVAVAFGMYKKKIFLKL